VGRLTLCGRSLKGTGTGAPLLGTLLEGSSTGDVERMKGALGMERLTLKRLRETASRGAWKISLKRLWVQESP
jgi:hypothetical protein